jgi:Lipase (class 3)/FYVE zinc finger
MFQDQTDELEGADGRLVPPPTSWFENERYASSWNDPDSPRGDTHEYSLSTHTPRQNLFRTLPNDQTDELQHSKAMNVNMLSPARSMQSSSSFIPAASAQLRPISHHAAPANVVGYTHPSPSWKEISSQVLPAAARELLSSSWRHIFHTARLSYSKGRWHRKYSDMGSNVAGIYLSGDSNFPFDDTMLPPFSSLNWVDRQLVREWRTYLPADDDSFDPDEDFDFARARALVPNPFPRPDWQKADVCCQCHKPFGPTRMRHHCRMCGQSFCHPHSSSSHRLPHLAYDPDVPERVCESCKRMLEEQNLAERVAWRLARCRDYSEGNLTPYFEMGLDSASEVALRITKAAIAMAKAIPLGAQATVAVETVDVLRKYGLHGIYGIMLRQEFLAAADLLRRALGINKTSWPLSVHELSAAIFYALAQHRAMRGLHPEREEMIHQYRMIDSKSDNVSHEQGTSPPDPVRTTVPAVIDNFASSALSFHSNPVLDETDTYTPELSSLGLLNQTFASSIGFPGTRVSSANNVKQLSTESSSPGFLPVCDPVSDKNLAELTFYAPIALNFVYATKEVDMQLLAAQQGWHLLYAFLEQDQNAEKIKDRPATALFLHRENKIACLSIRGTATIQDVITDIRQLPVPFPDQEPSVTNTNVKEKDDEWTSVFKGQGMALCGMASAAVNLFNEHIDSLKHFANQGYRIRVVGHSLGGGVAAMIGMLIMRELEQMDHLARRLTTIESDEESSLLHVYAYGTPSCLDATLAESVDPFVTTVVLHDDVFPRLTPTSCRALLKHLLHIRETWVKQNFNKDIHAVRRRASTVWRPKTRHSFTLVSTPSSSAIKKYCKKQIKNGKKTLLSVKDVISRQGSRGDRNQEGGNAVPTNPEAQESDNPREWGERLFVATTGLSQTLSTSMHEEVEKRDDSSISRPEPQLLLEFLGGADTKHEVLVVDGDEFFDTDENLVESDSEVSVGTESFRESISAATEAETPVIEISESWSIEPKNRDATTPESKGSLPSETGPAVVLDETPLPRMFVPGRVIHLYSHHGVYKAAYVPRTFRELRRISLAGNMLSDHTTKCYYEGLLEVQTARMAPEKPPKWSAFDEDDTCCCCASRFTWASTSNSAAQEARDKHNCRSCGGLVCDPCAQNRTPIPSIGLTIPVRICDRCYHDMGTHSAASSSLTSSFFAVDEDEQHSRDEPSTPGSFSIGTVGSNDIQRGGGQDIKRDERPERRREKRSLVVDELASRMRSSTVAPC